jgi:hypothetical protein
MKMKEKREPSLREMYEALRDDPDFWLLGAVSEFEATGNPYYAWMAIRVCIKHKKAFPEWLLAYLEICADRMESDQARARGDLRAILPWILGFPNIFDSAPRKPGPGNLLAPEGPDRAMFALRFAIRLEQGEKPLTALRNACNDGLDGIDRDADEKTLQRWLVKRFGLERWTSNADEWKTVCRENYKYDLAFLRHHWERTKSRETSP